MGGARSNLQSHVSLADTEFSPMLDEMKSASDYQNAGMLYYNHKSCWKIIF